MDANSMLMASPKRSAGRKTKSNRCGSIEVQFVVALAVAK
jgi:hypothetical protein